MCSQVVTPLPPTGILASICGGLVLLLPETKGIALPETVDDVEKLGRYCTARGSTLPEGRHRVKPWGVGSPQEVALSLHLIS